MHNKKLCSLVSRTHLTNLHSSDYTLLTKRGVSKLSDVDAKDYAALLAEVEVIGNAG